MRIGVLYGDGSMNVMSQNDGLELAEVRARSEMTSWNKQLGKNEQPAKLVSIDLVDGDVVEISQ